MLPPWLEKASLGSIETLGLYIHVPFCRRACHYCDFYFTPRASFMEAYTEALLCEIDHYAVLLEAFPIETVFFGGGTPSWLPLPLWDKIFRRLEQLPTYTPKEVTIEANPEDITPESLSFWLRRGVTRLSVGIQSFYPQVLHTLGRFHDPEIARRAINYLYKSGFTTWSADLIFGVPGQRSEHVVSDIEFLLSYNIPHLSAYGLTIEEKTVLYKKLRLGRFAPVEEETYAQSYLSIHEVLGKAGFTWYEISNWARPGHESQHNWRYWQRKPYIGLGPSAHSYLPEVRWANTRSIKTYLSQLESGIYPVAYWEALSLDDLRMELWITQFRTKLGLSSMQIRQHIGEKADYVFGLLDSAVQRGWLKRINDTYHLTPQGALLSDRLILEVESHLEKVISA
ncbi:MAG: radical SAM family heme chaperone HemW [Bacteroidia bacterium]|nr:radical SAM family heme chaperone HemW [Bacteroidia bacterium]